MYRVRMSEITHFEILTKLKLYYFLINLHFRLSVFPGRNAYLKLFYKIRRKEHYFI